LEGEQLGDEMLQNRFGNASSLLHLDTTVALNVGQRDIAAHRTLPLGTLVRVTNTTNRQFLTVRIKNDNDPYAAERAIDVSYSEAQSLGIVRRGVQR
jgi:hypothetical protein